VSGRLTNWPPKGFEYVMVIGLEGDGLGEGATGVGVLPGATGVGEDPGTGAVGVGVGAATVEGTGRGAVKTAGEPVQPDSAAAVKLAVMRTRRIRPSL